MKRKIGIIGFLIFFVGVTTAFIYKYFFQIEIEILYELSFLIGLTCFAIDWEYKKKNPSKKFINLILVVSSIATILLLYLYI